MTIPFYDLVGYNISSFKTLNILANKYLPTNFLYLYDYLFDIKAFPIYYLVGVFLAWYKIQSYNPTKKQFYFNQYYNFYLYLGLSYTIFGFIFAYLKFNINLPRPFCSLPLNDFISVIDISSERCLSSFPSAHTGLALIIAYFLSKNQHIIIKVFLYSNILLVAVTRIALAMHYPSDLIYGAIIASLTIMIAYLLKNLIPSKIHHFIKFNLYKILLKDHRQAIKEYYN